MRIFAIGDLHLEGGTGKTMDCFGENWRNHDQKIFSAWERIGRDDDLLLLVGDLTWAMRLEEALPDLARIGAMKGRKILIKGNHDYWWESHSKVRRALHPSVQTVQGSVIIERVAIAGTRGWLCPNDLWFKYSDKKIYEREVGRLRAALESLRGRETEFDTLVVALHYPAVNERHEPSGFTELLKNYRADFCVYGHLHGDAIPGALTGDHDGTRHVLVSADAVDFTPAEILRTDTIDKVRPSY